MPAEIAARTRDVAGAVYATATRTPVEPSDLWSTDRSRVWLKREDHQPTGSFKIRGATAKLSRTDAAEVIAASTGNHGAAVAAAATRRGIVATVYVSHRADPVKLDKIRRHGGRVEMVDGDHHDAEKMGRAAAETRGVPYVSPYNDEDVVAGQGTIGLEIAEQLPDAAAVVVATGGGGLVAGIAATLADKGAPAEIIAVQPAIDAAMHDSVVAGRIVPGGGGASLSDGTAGDLDPGSITFELCRDLVGRWVLVDEPAIATALERHRNATGEQIEGSAAMALAATLRLGVDGDVVVIVCGGRR